MKNQVLFLVLLVASVFAPETILPWSGMMSANAQQLCPYNPTPNPDTKPPTPPNNDQGSPEPVSFSTGAFYFSATDLKQPGVMPIVFTRYYNSSIGYQGPIGNNWDFSFNRYVTPTSGGLYYHTGRGYKILLTFTSGSGSVAAQSSTSEYYSATYNSSTNAYTVSDAYGNQDVFNSDGYLVETLDRNGNQLDYTRDGNGNLLSIQDPIHGQSITVTLDSHYHISSITDSFGRTVSYTYDSNYNLTEVTLPATADFPSGVTFQYGYDSDNRLTTKVDALGNTLVTNTYGSVGTTNEFRVVSQSLLGQTVTFSYNDTAQETIYTDAKGFVTDYYWDNYRDILKKIQYTAGIHSGAPASYETDYTYDSQQRKTQETYPNGNSTSWTYDGFNNVLTVTKSMPSGATVNSAEGTQALSATTTYTYEPRFNQVASITDPNGNETTYSYGTAGSNPGDNVLSITYPTTAAGTATESFTYNSSGELLTDTSADGTITQYTYDDSTGYLTQTVKDYGSGKLNATTQFTYDDYGHLASVEDANSHTTTFTTNALDKLTEIDGASGEVEQKSYDANGNLVADQKQAPGSAWQTVNYVYNDYEQLTASRAFTSGTAYLETDYVYDGDGNRTTVTDPLGHSVTTAYDERNMPYQITDALSKTVKYDYDGNGNVSKLTDELGNVTTYVYDGLDKLEKKNFPDSSYRTWSYDSDGNVTSLRTTAGNIVNQTYDSRNRMLTQSYGSSTITNAYDIMGRLSTATEGGAALSYSYDDLGRNISFTDQAGLTSSYSYDLVGNRTSTTYPTSVTVQIAHDASNRVTTLKDGSNNTQATYSYDSLDRATGITLANSTSISYAYDLLSRVTSVNNTLGGMTTRNYTYVYDDASRWTSETGPRGAVSFSYTNRNEVSAVTEPSGSPFNDQSFSYDAGFNRASWVNGTTTTNYTVNNIDQYTAVGSTTPTWNNDGGLAAYSGNTYVYDALMRLKEVDNSVGKYLFSYDPLGRRVKKVIESPTGTVLDTYSYHYDGNEVAVEYQPSATWTYYLGLGIDHPVMRINGTTKEWYYTNAQGSISAVADNSGDVLEQYEYNAQGQVQVYNGSGTAETGTLIDNSILYTGRNYDAETGNYYNRARYYNPYLGRFISRDPLSGAEFSQGTNLYAYCANDPTNFTDPTGLSNDKDGNGNSGYGNSGSNNNGNNNIGNNNTGDNNVGNNNTGNGNVGDNNTGDNNLGNQNNGNNNGGNQNNGDNNIGNQNNGNNNIGNNNSGPTGPNGGQQNGSNNTGNNNTGSNNTGSNNAGNGNSGSGNIGNGNDGSFNQGSDNNGSLNGGDNNNANDQHDDPNAGWQNFLPLIPPL